MSCLLRLGCVWAVTAGVFYLDGDFVKEATVTAAFTGPGTASVGLVVLVALGFTFALARSARRA